MSDQLQADTVLQSFNPFAASLGLKLKTKTKLQNVDAGDLPSTIIVDSVPVEGVARSSSTLAVSGVLMVTADQMCCAGLDLSAQ